MPDSGLENLNYEFIQTNDRAQEVLDQLFHECVIGVDTETTGLDPYNSVVLLVQIATPYQCFIFDVEKTGLEIFRQLFEDPKILKILQNAKFDYKMVKANSGISITNIFCTMIAERLIIAGLFEDARGKASLKNLAEKYVGIKLDKEIRKKFISNSKYQRDGFTKEELEYSANDALVLHPIYEQQVTELTDRTLVEVALLEFKVVPIVGDMELNGCLIDKARWENIIEQVRIRRDVKELQILKDISPVVSQSNIFGMPVVNINSPQQLVSCLKKMGVRKDDGKFLDNTDEASLKEVSKAHPIAAAILDYRGDEKLITAYGLEFLGKIKEKTGRLHAEFDQVRAATGRMSSNSPNLQQIPGFSEKDSLVNFRACFIAPPGRKIICADYSQQELRILADASKDRVFMKAYLNGEDRHKQTAADVYGVPLDKVTKDQRTVAKCVIGSTRILTDHGLVRIEDLSNFRGKDQFCTLEKFRIFDGEKFVESQFYYGGFQKTIRLELDNGIILEGTPSHRILSNGKWGYLKDIYTGCIIDRAPQEGVVFNEDYVVIPYNFWKHSGRRFDPEITESMPKLTLNEDWATFLGLIIGDGGCTTSSVYFCCGEKEFKDSAHRYEALCNKLGFNPSSKLSIRGGGKHRVISFQFASRTLVRFMKHIGVITGDIRGRKCLCVPEVIFKSPRSVIVAFLKGLFDTDGSISLRGQITFCSKSEQLCLEVQQLLMLFGINSKVSSFSAGRKQSRYYRLYVYDKKAFVTNIGFLCDKKLGLSSDMAEKFRGPDKKEMTVKTISYSEKEVFDVYVPTTNAFFGNGLINHNTLNFALIYGASAPKIAWMLGITKEEAQNLIHKYFRIYPSIKNFLEGMADEAVRCKFAYTISGRKRYFDIPEYGDPEYNRKMQRIRRQASNNFVQGSGADVTKQGLIYTAGKVVHENLDCKILMVVHDEIVMECLDIQAEKASKLLEECMIEGFTTYFKAIPMKVDAKISDCWSK